MHFSVRDLGPCGLVAVFVLTPIQARAQSPHGSDCLIADSSAVVDTLQPAGYFPLEVGNRWEYEYYNGAFALPPWGHLFREIVGDTTIDGVTYFRMWESRLTYHDGDPYIYERTDLVRHRASDSAFVSLRADAEYHFWESPFNLAAVRLEGPGWGIGSFCRPDSVSISDSVVGVAATKRFWSGGFEIAFAHGIGSTVFSGDGGPIATLVYARVGGGVFGTSIVGIDPAIPEPDKPLIVAVYPNPARDVVHIEPATLGFPTLLEVFDLTGRRVEQRHLPPFPSHQSIAVSRWPAGWYLLRLSGRGRAWSEILVIL